TAPTTTPPTRRSPRELRGSRRSWRAVRRSRRPAAPGDDGGPPPLPGLPGAGAVRRCGTARGGGMVPHRAWSGAGQDAGAGHLRVPAGAGLGDAGAGRVVDVDRAEPLAVAVGPLEVVQQRPQEVAAHVGAVLDGPVDGGQVAAHVGDPGGVVDPALGVGVVVEGRTVLR